MRLEEIHKKSIEKSQEYIISIVKKKIYIHLDGITKPRISIKWIFID
jgi:hypothetical protein